MVYVLSPFPPSFVFFPFLTPSLPALCAFISKKLPKKFPVSFAFAVIRPTFAPAFGKEPSGSPGVRKKKSPEIWRIWPEVVTFASAFPFSGMHLVKDSSLKRFHKRSKQYKSRAILARRIWQPSAARSACRRRAAANPGNEKGVLHRIEETPVPFGGSGRTIHLLQWRV